MTEGKRMKLGDFFRQKEQEARQRYAEQLAWEATPEGKAWLAEQAAERQRMREAEERYAAENKPDIFQQGRDDREAGAAREAPEDLTDEQADEWLAGWDSLGSDEDDAP